MLNQISCIVSIVILCVLGLCIGNIHAWRSDNSDRTFYIALRPTFTDGRIYYATNPAGPWHYYQPDRNIP